VPRQHIGDLAGAALVYRLCPEVDYVVAWGDRIQYRSDGVVSVLARHLICVAIEQRLALIDMGISAVAGTPDDGLVPFKRSGGGIGLRPS